jgi:hypothetical protein
MNAKLENLKKELFFALCEKYKAEHNPKIAAAYAIEGFTSYYKNASIEDQAVLIQQDIEDVRKGLSA